MDGAATTTTTATATATATETETAAKTRKLVVRLTDGQRERLSDVTRNGNNSAKRIMHARVLLMSDAGHPLGRYPDAEIARALGVSGRTVGRVRTTFVRHGETVALDRKVRAAPPTPPRLDGAGEAALAAICCSPPPDGRARWSMSLLADALVARGVVVSICKETVRRALKKASCSPGG